MPAKQAQDSGKEQVEKKLPIGVDLFEKVRSEDFYYVDKTDWYGICSSQVVW